MSSCTLRLSVTDFVLWDHFQLVVVLYPSYNELSLTTPFKSKQITPWLLQYYDYIQRLLLRHTTTHSDKIQQAWLPDKTFLWWLMNLSSVQKVEELSTYVQCKTTRKGPWNLWLSLLIISDKLFVIFDIKRKVLFVSVLFPSGLQKCFIGFVGVIW